MIDSFTIMPDHLQYVRNVAHNGVKEAHHRGLSRLALVPVEQWIPFRLVPDARGEIVLDGNGNLILRVGKYGNVDDGVPLVKRGGPANPTSIGGDEVALFYAPHVAVHTDRRLFIADVGNERIVSVKLGYHADEMIPLKGVQDGEE